MEKKEKMVCWIYKTIDSNYLLTSFLSKAFNCGGLDLIIVPGVAFDKNNGRLGHGKGYYDRFFDKVKEFSSLNDKKIPKLIAIAFNEQIIDEVPMSGSDHKVDFVLYQLNQKDLDEIWNKNIKIL